MKVIIALILMPVLAANAYWDLKWSDEFNQKQIDQNNWEITNENGPICDNQKINRFNCYTNSSRNIRLIDGTLALTAIYEKHKNMKYTSAWIKSKKTFTYGKIEIKAALPVGKLLSPWIKLVNPKFKDRDGGINNNQIIVFSNAQSNYIRYGISFKKRVDGSTGEYLAYGNLGDLHTYSVEWNETDLIWIFDGEQTNWVNLTNSNTFLTNPVTLMFYLRVGGQPFRGEKITLEDVYDWSCSLLIFDYIRYYHWVKPDVNYTKEIETQNISSISFCKNVMSEIQPVKIEPGTSINLTAVISGLSLVILLSLIPLIVWLVLRMQKMRKQEQRTADLDNYYDDINQMEMYENVNKVNEYDYADPYKMYSDANTEGNRNTNYYTSPDLSTSPIVVSDEQDYITMTSKQGKYLKIEPVYTYDDNK